jgi:predicted metalloprotease with PDZ domain
VAEGVTSYYQDVLMKRAGLITDKEFLESLARALQSYQRVPGRRVMTAEEASFDTWIKYYRQDENSVNSQIDYYDKGAILGLLLDLEIRKLSHNAKSLDDVMRALYAEFFKQGRNYTPADFQRLCEQMAGASLDDFFARYVRGREEHDYNRALTAAGLRLDTSEATGGAKAVEKAYLGADLTQENDRLMVSRVLEGSPAYEQGLNTGDQIVAFDNMRVNRDSFDARLAEKRPGQLVSLTIFRFDDLSALPIKLGSMSNAVYRIVPVEKPTDEQKRIYQSWLRTN